MSILCIFGIHHDVIAKEVIIGQRVWKRFTFYGFPIPNTDYIRNKIVRIEECSRCKRQKAYIGLDAPYSNFEEVSLEFAQSNIDAVK